ncbi:MAG: hypothetical protein CGU28_12415 [Candidatus Dactylopiibacterium carminicum]|uniref:Uncharacterized protein n=1 Tax=Candidatus Dactylopiibacterium carminicum TaxID=857335 RepID=A0A272EQU3_9RHOO|nr:hypothetical protein BGI27_12970 [Candidatus Dactylopiibacterium carminicum]PAS92080.1 MAG: hypothetical protein CGU29_13090 [Candidatus Dactylopiibacterium carminicum]PAS95502.1 MAG: hypothetical protein CGU28_12415 [Candidatus Dactylopiibacterium carminicum]PAS97884.1 MAG: hypothetical protein BSR46_12990 [Candidatus Dactylopiibacterium carminicum]
MLLDEHHESLLADALYLLSRSATVGVCRGRMTAVIKRLDSVAGEEAFPPMLRATVERLLIDWREAQAREFGGGTETESSRVGMSHGHH